MLLFQPNYYVLLKILPCFGFVLYFSFFFFMREAEYFHIFRPIAFLFLWTVFLCVSHVSLWLLVFFLIHWVEVLHIEVICCMSVIYLYICFSDVMCFWFCLLYISCHIFFMHSNLANFLNDFCLGFLDYLIIWNLTCNQVCYKYLFFHR